jgi:hypothetical protein
MVMFIKLGPKHASKDEIELAVFEVLGKFLLTVFDTVSCSQYSAPSSGSWYSPSFTLSAIAHTSKHAINISTHITN